MKIMEIQRIFNKAYEKLIEATTEDEPLNAAYWQGKKDGLRTVMAMILYEKGKDLQADQVMDQNKEEVYKGI